MECGNKSEKRNRDSNCEIIDTIKDYGSDSGLNCFENNIELVKI